VTLHLHRILCLAAAARIAALNTWLKNNIDPAGGDWVAARLSATGTPPATHGWFCAGLTSAQGAAVLNRWYALASMTPPNWGSLTRAQVRSRIATDRAALRAATQINVFHADNDGAWDSPEAALAATGLQRVA
jgi:hypothetical protein